MISDTLEEVQKRLAGLQYQPGHFRDLVDDPLCGLLWTFLTDAVNAARMEACTFCERPAVECLGPGLLATFGLNLKDPENERYKQLMGHMARQVMEALGYTIQPERVRITRDSLFTLAARYEGPMISRAQREEWLKHTADTPFNKWLDRQIRDPNGTINRQMLRDVARRFGIDSEYPHLNAGHERMVLGCMLRRRVRPSDYEGA